MERPDALNPSAPINFAQLRAILSRVVARTCPAWVASQREDLVQTACLRIVKKFAGTEEHVSIGTSYLWKVAHSVIMDELRRRRRRPELELETIVHAAPEANAPTPEVLSAASEMATAIADGLRTLKEDRRWAVLLYLYGFTLKDSAGVLGWTPKRVDNQRYQGLADLRAYLRERGFQP